MLVSRENDQAVFDRIPTECPNGEEWLLVVKGVTPHEREVSRLESKELLTDKRYWESEKRYGQEV